MNHLHSKYKNEQKPGKLVPGCVMDKGLVVLDTNENVTKTKVVSSFLMKTSKHLMEGNACKISR